jgi:hypothetical protein
MRDEGAGELWAQSIDASASLNALRLSPIVGEVSLASERTTPNQESGTRSHMGAWILSVAVLGLELNRNV